MPPQGVRLGTVQEALLIPLYGRAVENRKQGAALRDNPAEKIATSIDYDFTRFDNLPSLIGTVLRTSLFRPVGHRLPRRSSRRHRGGIGAGLNTRYERADNGRARSFELDLPDVIDLRRAFFADTPRRTMLLPWRTACGRTPSPRAPTARTSSPPRPSYPSCRRRMSTTS
ncbi:hypothetical protein ABZ656_11820 [Streptomyces sp. NPDC007095]|uniref:hypothetical protein n=1 Tax=Streptomyces sp. NPDC007095 TaxID=3154482 RepID=UPI0033D564F7